MTRSEQGFTLVEVLVSIVILSIVSFSLLNIFSQSLKTTNDSLNRTIANQVAQNTLHTLDRRASTLQDELSLSKLVPSGAHCPFCTEINGQTFQVDVNETRSIQLDNTLEIEVSVMTETMTTPVSLKGVISNATLREPFPETAVPESEDAQ
ncbi:prepilin-type N-terminal cleavage/methylation domain-containing protein [Exiguobacterium aurantiacum]|uniref:Prepilin-type N-terminal cleavage/methylation domain-containing protein n=1 Tax=Exiguobacterium aurantiacum TaxID=33987 RepID=A0ABY5FKG6_9BACL|nr:prepilin-type N-terminal cleavage/methylation domain-containing protein [Exiguobacterium aurantiacum]UTT42057.1 prepilin-type N-terminal cleavage/methylation domain-containing protein [Exiguobacterium aurantiacum]